MAQNVSCTTPRDTLTDTFSDVFERLNPGEFRAGFGGWVQRLVRRLAARSLAIDGKVLRGSKDDRLGQQAIDMLVPGPAKRGSSLGK